MRLSEGIVVDAAATFGELKFSALRRESFYQDENGASTGELKERTYDLKSRTQGMMIQVGIPATVELKKFDYNAMVELVNPVVDTVSVATYGGRANAGWYIKADDIVLKTGSGSASGSTATSAGGKAQTEQGGAAGAQNAKKG